MTDTPSAPPETTRSAREVFTAISGLVVGMFVAVLSGTVVSTSMPVIIADLGGTQSQYTWVITASLLATAVSTPIWGKLADLVVLDADPSRNIRDSTKLAYVLANGRLFDAMTMNEVAPEVKARRKLWWE